MKTPDGNTVGQFSFDHQAPALLEQEFRACLESRHSRDVFTTTLSVAPDNLEQRNLGTFQLPVIRPCSPR